MLTELCVASGASVKRPVATAPLATNVTIVIVTGVAILPRKIFLRLAFTPALEPHCVFIFSNRGKTAWQMGVLIRLVTASGLLSKTLPQYLWKFFKGEWTGREQAEFA